MLPDIRKKILCSIIIIVSLVFGDNRCKAQGWGYGGSGGHSSGSNYLELNQNTSWNFSCTSPSDLETDQVITNAFSLHIRSKASSCSVYVQLSSWTHPTGFSGSCPIQIDYQSTTSPNAYNIVTGPLTVTTTNQRLFNQSKTARNYAYYFYYNLRMQAMGYDYVPGTYGYTLTFTMTQP